MLLLDISPQLFATFSILVMLLVAAILGFWLGWIQKELRLKKKYADLEDRLQRKIDEYEKLIDDRRAVQDQLNSLKREHAALKGRFSEVSGRDKKNSRELRRVQAENQELVAKVGLLEPTRDKYLGLLQNKDEDLKAYEALKIKHRKLQARNLEIEKALQNLAAERSKAKLQEALSAEMEKDEVFSEEKHKPKEEKSKVEEETSEEVLVEERKEEEPMSLALPVVVAEDEEVAPEEEGIVISLVGDSSTEEEETDVDEALLEESLTLELEEEEEVELLEPVEKAVEEKVETSLETIPDDFAELVSEELEKGEEEHQELEGYIEENELEKLLEEKIANLDFERIGRATEEDKDDLRQIKGIGPATEKRLNEIGIYTYKQIANFTHEEDDIIKYFPGRLSRKVWVDEARRLLGMEPLLEEKEVEEEPTIEPEEKEEVKEDYPLYKGKYRIIDDGEETEIVISLDLDRLGRATEDEKDDLKKIKGIGPATEKRLNELGIFTYRQIANFTEEEEEMIKWLPGRLNHKVWVEAAKRLMGE